LGVKKKWGRKNGAPGGHGQGFPGMLGPQKWEKKNGVGKAHVHGEKRKTKNRHGFPPQPVKGGYSRTGGTDITTKKKKRFETVSSFRSARDL